MYIDFKVTAWERVEIPEEIEQEVLEKIQNGEIKSANEVFEKCQHDELNCEMLLDTSLQMKIEENDFNSTIEVFNDDSALIWKNGQEDLM